MARVRYSLSLSLSLLLSTPADLFFLVKKTEIWDSKKVAKNYIKDFFFIDFICCVPGFPLSVVLEKTLSASGDEATLLKLGKAPRVLKVVRTLKIVKVFRVLKIARTIQDIKDTVRGLGTRP